jgi:hypothetical protein
LSSQEIAGPRNITIEKIEQEINKSPLEVLSSPKRYEGKSNITIEGFDFRKLDKTDEKQCAVSDCQNITIRRCIFGKKKTLGQALNITGSKTKNVTVEYCIFEDMFYTESNGGEPLRIGLSELSGVSLDCTIRYCIFRNLNSDPETISIKSVGNKIEDNFFLNNKSNVTVRHGGKATIQHNYFRGRGGIRLHGYGNRVLYNCHEVNPGEDSYSPVVLRYGNADKDPNWKDEKTPNEKAGQSHAIYARTVDNEVSNNEFKQCQKTVIELKKGASLSPRNPKRENNKEVDKFTFESSIPVPPVEPPVEPPAEETLNCEVCGAPNAQQESYFLCANDSLRVEIMMKAFAEYEQQKSSSTA